MAYLYAAFGAVLLTAIVTAAEYVAAIERYTLRSRVCGFIFTAINASAGVIFLSVLIALWEAIGVRPLLKLPINGWTGDAASIMLLVLLNDFVTYWSHRFQHRFLWPIHSLHHSQTELHAANGYAHFTERSFRYLVFGIPLSLIGFEFAAAPYLITLLSGVLERYIHSPTTAHLGPLRYVLVDNRFHRIHHSLEPQHFDKNFGILFSFWDRIFGTAWEPRADEWPATGVAGLHPPASVLDYLLFPLKFVSRTGAAAPARRT
ncbi:MAG TPA: sterol desaturase family protein [Sphingomicrobium sp.]|nr:sterol desaturase family protein [Sphingomicrobium sp.]